ncbi:imidazole glycerol phosphate synthase subunit HisH [Thiohalobacter sp. IOR34]|uniref:imidazole glycerol phosphate synthase subunit HisH n=1 Tax=Thiohalobacter sp. IOR34 TaxID=3057176 RepID=UPI0025B17584|nr:imidazole glycerol phosphate synthase subunit HisH [Thiohalobacter sp. IOR34]WJW75642.1 imidazole glycerol phosphate synthase subunit HisH [Thiohalobacter sp. IOR34]
MNSVAIIDYGMGNLHSIAKALEHVAGGAQVQITREPRRILAAARVVFPGVGAIGHCMEELRRLELVGVIREAAATRPLLGVCLGMQALLEFSEENEGTPALGLIPGRVRRFPEGLRDAAGERLKVPHMGWNQVQQRPHPLWAGIPQDSRFYFVHSYYAEPAQEAHVAGRTDYGLTFASAIGRDNLFAVQFHPEKSQTVGLRLLANFLAWDGTV